MLFKLRRIDPPSLSIHPPPPPPPPPPPALPPPPPLTPFASAFVGDNGGDGVPAPPFHRCSVSLPQLLLPLLLLLLQPVDDIEEPDDSSDDSGDDWLIVRLRRRRCGSQNTMRLFLFFCLSFVYSPAQSMVLNIGCGSTTHEFTFVGTIACVNTFTTLRCRMLIARLHSTHTHTHRLMAIINKIHRLALYYPNAKRMHEPKLRAPNRRISIHDSHGFAHGAKTNTLCTKTKRGACAG